MATQINNSDAVCVGIWVSGKVHRRCQACRRRADYRNIMDYGRMTYSVDFVRPSQSLRGKAGKCGECPNYVGPDLTIPAKKR